MQTVRMMFLIRSLRRGGAERQLVTLANGLAERDQSPTVVEFYGGGDLGAELLPAVRRVVLCKRARWDLLAPGCRLVAAIRRERPAVIHGYQVEPNIAALAAKVVLPSARVVWGVRASVVDISEYDWFTRGMFRLARSLSQFADVIIANSEAARAHYELLGYPCRKLRVVPNGIDTEYFRPHREGRARVRNEWGVGQAVPLVGVVGRIDPLKDHRTFVAAASIVSAEYPRARFVIVGDGPEAYIRDLRTFARSALGDRIVWARGRDDMAAVYSALDVGCSSSVTESFANAIAEAMACGVPCVVTDVGDSGAIVGSTGRVVPPRSPVALADGICKLLERVQAGDGALSECARARIVQRYGVDRLVDLTLESVVDSRD
jgi:glycosyltransferase involved in cell wall biosynthesis